MDGSEPEKPRIVGLNPLGVLLIVVPWAMLIIAGFYFTPLWFVSGPLLVLFMAAWLLDIFPRR